MLPFAYLKEQKLVPATSSLLPPLLFESPLSLLKIRGASHPPLLNNIAFTSLVFFTTVYITATIAIFTAGIALRPYHVINIRRWRVTGPEKLSL